MSINWKFKIELQQNSFEKIEENIGTSLPEELKSFIENNNAASPDKNKIVINGNERVFNSVLSFNEKETEAATFKSVYRAIGNKNMIPFASDPFGNYFCYSLGTGKIAYYKHEENRIDNTEYSLADFLDNLM